jgi:protein gp37
MRLQKILAFALAVISPLAVRAQNITTVAGGGSTGVPALPYSIGGPEDVIKDGLGNIYILDNFFSRVFKVDTAGNMTIYAGNGTAGYSGDTGPANLAQLSGPSAMFMNAAGDLFIADSDNSVIREVPFANGVHYGITMKAGFIYTIAGVAGNLDYNGDNIPATTAFLNVPDGVFVDGVGNVFIGDRFNHIVRELANVSVGGKTAGNIYTIAGTIPTGTSPNTVPQPGFAGDGGPATGAKLHDPWGVYGDSHGSLFIADRTNNAIREIAGTPAPAGQTTGNIYTIVNTATTAGTGGDTGPAAGAQLHFPHGVFVDAANDLFISDYENHAIREVPFATTVTPPMTAGHIYTIAGTLGTKGNSVDGTAAKTAALAHPSNVFFDASGNLFIADSDADTIREVPFANGTNYTVTMIAGDIYTIAGNGFLSFGGDGAIATNAELDAPFAPTSAIGIATDTAGNLFIADTSNDVIREVTVADGFIHTIVGAAGFDAFSGDGGPAASAHINNPNGVFVDSHNNIFIADTGNCLIREVVASTGNIATFAGTAPVLPSPPNPPVCGSTGDQGSALTAQLNAPNTVFVDGSDNVFIADTLNHAIREIPATTTTGPNGKTAGHIYTVAGTLNMSGPSADGVLATAALLNEPQGVFVDSFGNLFIADTKNQVIREVPAQTGTNYGISMTAGNIYTVAGTPQTAGFGGDTGPATGATLRTPFAVLVDDAGNIFISDSGNHIIREVPAATGNGKTVGHIYTAVGTNPLPPPPVLPVGGFAGDGGLATSAKLNLPQGLAAGTTRNLLVADSNNVRIRSIGPNLLAAPASAATLDKTTLTFTPAQLVGSTSAAQVITLTAHGTAPLTITSIAVTGTNSGDFAENDTCPKSPATLALGTSCTISVTFTPTANGPRTGSITFTDDASTSPQMVTLTGTGGTPTADLSGTSLTFTNQPLNTPSTSQSVTLTNNGAVALAIASITLTGANSGDFTLTPANTCGSSVAAGANCIINVTFRPTAVGIRTAVVTLTDNAASAKQTINLTGTGIAPAVGFNPSSLTFSAQTVATAAPVQTITLTNNGSATLSVTSIAVSGANSADFTQTNTCGTSVAAAATCTISVKFTPSATGSRTASIIVTDNAAGGTQTIALTGTGVAASTTLTFSTASATQTVKAGQTATYNMQLAATGGTGPISVAVTCTEPASLTLAPCSIAPVSPISVTPGTPATFTVSVKTTGTAALLPGTPFAPNMQPPAALRTVPLTLLAMLLVIATALARMQSPAGRMRTVRLAMAACLIMLPLSSAMMLVGCASSGSSSTPTPTPTPSTAAGTYTLTITGTANGTTQTTSLTLVVQ